jgi:hypothetical protein
LDGRGAAEFHNQFVVPAATAKYIGLETRDGRSLRRFDFYTPLLSSHYTPGVRGK